MSVEIITASQGSLRYNEYLWGEIYYGTKADLASLGLAAGMVLPGEPEGPKRMMKVIDPRGFESEIRLSRTDGVDNYSVRIVFPDWIEPERARFQFAPGVLKDSNIWWCDLYFGSAAALCEAGLVIPTDLPGLPGMNKTSVTILPNGAVLGRDPTPNRRESRSPGAKHIEIVAKDKYKVTIFIPDVEAEARRDANDNAEQVRRDRMSNRPRPASLVTMARLKKPSKPTHLRLVWAAPHTYGGASRPTPW